MTTSSGSGLTEAGSTQASTARAGAEPSIMEGLWRIPDAEQRIAAYYAATGEKVVNLAIADNVLLYESLKKDVFDKASVSMDDTRYKAPPYGLPDLREHVTDLLHETFSPKIDATTDVFATAGVSGALESLAFALIEAGAIRAGDRVLLPVPCWQGFWWCFEQRPGLRVAPVRPETDFQLTLQDIERTYEEALKQDPGHPPKLLALTTPHNPLGINYSRDFMNEVFSWAMSKPDLHVVSDEIYAHSQIEGVEPTFTSALSLDSYADHTDRIHLVWGLGKDFGLSGFRTGFLVTKSKPVQEAVRGTGDHEPMAWFGPLDSLKRVYVDLLFPSGSQEPKWLPRALMQEYGRLLTEAHRAIAGELDMQRIRYVGQGEERRNPAQFFLLDLREYLRPGRDVMYAGSPNLFPEIDESEAGLATWIKDRANVQLLPGLTQRCPEPGYFRLCFTAYPPLEVRQAVRDVRTALNQLPPAH